MTKLDDCYRRIADMLPRIGAEMEAYRAVKQVRDGIVDGAVKEAGLLDNLKLSLDIVGSSIPIPLPGDNDAVLAIVESGMTPLGTSIASLWHDVYLAAKDANQHCAEAVAQANPT